MKPGLHAAAARGDTEAVSVLLQQGADVNGRDAYRTTPLMSAAKKNQLDTVGLLLGQGADPLLCDVAGYTALDWAGGLGHRQTTCLLIADVLCRPNANLVDMLFCAASGGDAAALHQVLDRIQDQVGDVTWINSSISFPFTNPLAAAAFNDNIDSATALQARGINTHPRSCGVALLEAVKQGHVRMTRLLLGRGADLTVWGIDGLTALRQAIANGHVEIIEMLTAAGARE